MNRFPMKISLPLSTAASLLISSLLTGCAVGPDYVRPEAPSAATFKEAGNWKAAEPADDIPRGNWWQRYGDSQLDTLVDQLAVSNQNVLAAEASLRQALGALDANRAALWPSLSSGVSESRGRAATTGNNSGNPAPITQTDRLSLTTSWEVDVWGRLRRAAEAGNANAQASAGDLRSALLSAQATLVQTYLQIRISDAQKRLLQETTQAYDKALTLTRNRYEGGVATQADVAQAETQLNTAKVQLIDLGVQRAQYEHAIAILLGKAPADFQLEESLTPPTLPDIPLAIPSTLLERRPDVAAAERRAAAANAQIGVAKSAFFPALTLSGTGGYQNNAFSQLVSAPHRFWSAGPALALTLFDADARSAAKAQAEAGYDKAVAQYRQSVLTAFQEVEDNLAALRLLEQESRYQNLAAQSAEKALRITENQYIAGTVSYLNVVTAQTADLSAKRNQLDILNRRLAASTLLLKALGGDWHLATQPQKLAQD